MAKKGTYQWWLQNYATDPEFQRVCRVLKEHGVDCSEVEIDHFPPNAAYTGSRFDRMLPYAARPSLPLPKYLHRYRKGGGGMGGHASTTGSTHVSKGWTPQLQKQMAAGDFYGAIKRDIIDKRNVALFATEGLDRNLFNKLMIPAVDWIHEQGMVNETQYYDLLQDLGAWD